MARKDAMERLRRRLLERRAELLRRLYGDVRRDGRDTQEVGDTGDAASAEFCSDLNHRVAAMESEELRQIERALKKFRRGRYGVCEHCGRKIPVARLQALPYAAYCVGCQELRESRSEQVEDCRDWGRVGSFDGALEDREPEFGQLDIPE